jgi:hypothetical protein
MHPWKLKLRVYFFWGPHRATVMNTTIEEDDPRLTYTGEWDNNTAPEFSGGGTAFTHGDGASVTLSFRGRKFSSYFTYLLS